MRDEALVWAVFLLGGAVLNFMLLFAWNIVRAPYRLERERRKEAEKRTTAVESRNRTLENEIVALRGGIATASWVSDLPSHRRQGTKIIFTPPVRFVGRLRIIIIVPQTWTRFSFIGCLSGLSGGQYL